MSRSARVETPDGFAVGDRVVRQFPTMEPKEGTVRRLSGDAIVVAWDWGGFPQVLPPDQRTYVTKVAPR